jgi:hypothetical protein
MVVRYLLTAFAAVVVYVGACDKGGAINYVVEAEPPPGVVIAFGVPMSDSEVASFARRNNLVLDWSLYYEEVSRLEHRFNIDRDVVPDDSTVVEIAAHLAQAYPDTIDNVYPDPDPEG